MTDMPIPSTPPPIPMTSCAPAALNIKPYSEDAAIHLMSSGAWRSK